jgi:hypothetical protein
MKKIHYIALLMLGLLVTNCNTNDDGFYLNKFVETNGLIVIAPHSSTYTLNEKLYVQASIPRLLSETGQGTQLDLVKTTGATEFTFSYVIEKQNGTNWDIVYVANNQLDLVKGSLWNDQYLLAGCDYVAATDSFEYEVGFPLLSAGTYRLGFGYNGEATDRVNIRSQSMPAHVILNLNTTVAGLDASGFYNFTVTN